MSNYYYSGQGSLYVAKRDVNGKPLGFMPIGNVPELTIDIEISKFEHKESESGSRLLDLSIVKEKKGKFKMKVENLSLENLALGLYGENAAVVGGTVVDEPVKFYKGKRMPLAHPDVSAVVVKDVTGVTTYVLNTDYTVDAANGVLIFPASGSTITTDGTDLEVSYTYGAYSKLEAFTSAESPERWLRFEGLNTVDGSNVIIDCYRAQFDPLTGYALINEEIASLDMNGSLLADTNITSGSKFFRQRNVAA